MSETLDRLQQAVHDWHDRRKTELQSEAAFLKSMLDSGDAVSMAEAAGTTRYSELIADSIAELLGSP